MRTIAVLSAAFVCTLTFMAQAQQRPSQLRPPVGGVASPTEAMIFYAARGPVGSCGKDCSEWIVAEGAVQWDTHKRLFNFLDRNAGLKAPVVIDTWGFSNLDVPLSLGRILRERGLSTTVGMTYPLICANETERACFELKRAAASPLNAQLHTTRIQCDIACMMILAGGVRRSIPSATKATIRSTTISNRFGSNVSGEHREGLLDFYGEKTRRYFVDMGVDPEIVDMIARARDLPRSVELPPSEWQRLRLVTEAVN
jgi:hypothetical protein